MNLEMVVAKPEDAEVILNYKNLVGLESENLTFGKEGSGATIEKEKERLALEKKSENSVTYLCKKGGEIAAMGSLKGFSRERIKHRAELALTVKKEYWKQGIAKKMMQTLLQHARDKTPLETIELIVRSDNQSAIHLYENFGFQNSGIYERYFKIEGVYFSANLMCLNLE